MATILDKDLVRESTEKFDSREILVTITEKQTISFKLKGMKSGEVSIGILPLYKQLTGIDDSLAKGVRGATIPVKLPKKIKDLEGDPMINLYRLRALNMVTKMDISVKLELEKLICELIKQDVKIFEENE